MSQDIKLENSKPNTFSKDLGLTISCETVGTDSCDIERATSRSEVWGFYLCFFSKSPIEVLSGVIAPLVVQKLATSAAVIGDLTTPCDPNVPKLECFVQLGGSYLNVTSYTLFVTAIGILLQCFVLVQLGPLADYGNGKQWALVISCIIGCVGCLLFLIATRPELYWVAALASILVNVCYATFTGFMYAYMPMLARSSDAYTAASALPIAERDEIKSRFMNHLLIRAGVGGQVLSTAVCVLAAVITMFLIKATAGMAIGLSIGGVVWLIFGSAGCYLLGSRPRPRLTNYCAVLFLGWRQVGFFLWRCRQLSNLSWCMISYIFYIDACKLLLTVPLLMAQDELKLSDAKAFGIAAFAPFLEGVGIQISFFVLNRFKNKFNITKCSLLVLLLIHIVLNIYLILGIYTGIGVHSEVELFVYYTLVALIIGPTFNFYYVLYNDMVPPGHESFFASIQQIFGRGSSWLGPIFVGIMASNGLSIRNAFWLTFVMFILSVVFLLMCNINRGRGQALRFKF